MADDSDPLARASAAAMAAKYPVFIDTNLDTHFLMSLSLLDTVSDFKRKIEKEHSSLFSDIGDIVVQALKVKRRGIFYVLSDSMFVDRAFASSKSNWFLGVDASREPRREIDAAPAEKQAELENGLVEKHVELENSVAEKQAELENDLVEKHVEIENVVVEKQALQPVKRRKRKPEQPVALSREDTQEVDIVSGKKKRITKSKGDKAPDDASNVKNVSESHGLDIETSAPKKTEASKENPENREMAVEISAQNGVVLTKPATEEQAALLETLDSPRREETRPKTTDGGNESVVEPIETGKKRKRVKKAKDSDVPAEPLLAQSGKVRDEETALSPKEGNEAPKENPKSSVVVPSEEAVNEVETDKNVENDLSCGNGVMEENRESLDVAREIAVNEKPGEAVEEPEKKKPKRKLKASSKRIILPESQDDIQMQDLSLKDGDEAPKERSAVAAVANEGAEKVEEPVKKTRTRNKQTEVKEDIVVIKSKPVTRKKLKFSKDQIDSVPAEPEIGTQNLTKVYGTGNKEKGVEKKEVPKSTSPTETANLQVVSGTGKKDIGPKKPLVEKKGLVKSTSQTETENPKVVSGTNKKEKGLKKPLVEKKGLVKRAPKTQKAAEINVKNPDTHSVQTSSNAQTSLNTNRKQETRAVFIPELVSEEKSDESMVPSESNIDSPKAPEICAFQVVERPRNITTKVGFKTPFKSDTGDATLKKSLGTEKKKLIATPGAIFGDENSSSGDLGTDGSDDSTRTPSFEQSSSEDSDSNSLQRGGSQTQDKLKNAKKTSFVKSRSASGKKNSLPFELLIRNTSGYKNAKLTASQSQPEDDTQTPDFVPESQL